MQKLVRGCTHVEPFAYTHLLHKNTLIKAVIKIDFVGLKTNNICIRIDKLFLEKLQTEKRL